MSTESKSHRELTEEALIPHFKGRRDVLAYAKVQPDGRTRVVVKKATRREIESSWTGVVVQSKLPTT